MPKNYKPTPSHLFQKLLIDKGHVLKVYTQNIDALETIAKFPKEKLLQHTGLLKRATVLAVKMNMILIGWEVIFFDTLLFEIKNIKWFILFLIKEKLESVEYLKCESSNCLNSELGSLPKIVKPDITFFGENLPQLFMKSYAQDVESCDLLIVKVISICSIFIC